MGILFGLIFLISLGILVNNNAFEISYNRQSYDKKMVGFRIIMLIIFLTCSILFFYLGYQRKKRNLLKKPKIDDIGKDW